MFTTYIGSNVKFLIILIITITYFVLQLRNYNVKLNTIFQFEVSQDNKLVSINLTTNILIGNMLSQAMTSMDKFQSISRTNRDIFLYSAYYDHRFIDSKQSSKSVVIHTFCKYKTVGQPLTTDDMTFWKDGQSIVCKIIYKFYNISSHQYEYIEFLSPTSINVFVNDGRLYRYSTINCYIANISVPYTNNNLLPIITLIGIKRPKTNILNFTTFENALQVHEILLNPSIKNYANQKLKICACIKPMYNFNAINRLIEYIETNAMLGVDKFYIYNCTALPQVGMLFDWYKSRENLTHQRLTKLHGIEYYKLEVKVIQFQLPDEISVNITRNSMLVHWWGQHLADNDCLMRTAADGNTHTMMTDLDETIVPLSDFITLSDLMKNIYQHNLNKKIAAFQFSSKYFLPSLHYNDYNHPDLETLNVFKTWPTHPYAKIHVKLIVDLRYVMMGAVHKVVIAEGTQVYKCNISNEGILHHYRPLTDGYETWSLPIKLDFTFLKYNFSDYRNAFQRALNAMQKVM